jgi:hypothetical protein
MTAHPSSTAKAARFNYHDDDDDDLVFKQRAIMHNFCFLFLLADESALHQEVLVVGSSNVYILAKDNERRRCRTGSSR